MMPFSFGSQFSLVCPLRESECTYRHIDAHGNVGCNLLLIYCRLRLITLLIKTSVLTPNVCKIFQLNQKISDASESHPDLSYIQGQ